MRSKQSESCYGLLMKEDKLSQILGVYDVCAAGGDSLEAANAKSSHDNDCENHSDMHSYY